MLKVELARERRFDQDHAPRSAGQASVRRWREHPQVLDGPPLVCSAGSRA